MSTSSLKSVPNRIRQKVEDGRRLSAADGEFLYREDVDLHEVGELADLVKIDDYTYSITFAAPFGAYEDLLPTEIHWEAGHYLQQFHASFASKADLDKAMSDAGFDTWIDLYGAKAIFADNQGRPDIMAWISENPIDDPIQRAGGRVSQEGLDLGWRWGQTGQVVGHTANQCQPIRCAGRLDTRCIESPIDECVNRVAVFSLRVGYGRLAERLIRPQRFRCIAAR